MEDFSNLAPQTNREWLQHITHKLDLILESQEEDRETMAKFIEKTDCWITDHSKESSARAEKIDQLEKKVNSWSLVNSLAAVGAAIGAFFGIAK